MGKAIWIINMRAEQKYKPRTHNTIRLYPSQFLVLLYQNSSPDITLIFSGDITQIGILFDHMHNMFESPTNERPYRATESMKKLPN